ncbi:hypothetical protein [Nonomuraea rubra]|uniref:hypothetical protein n=1 Tax=Nonomuraea rubra TaxID=46180 RepID=UPI00340B6FB0
MLTDQTEERRRRRRGLALRISTLLLGVLHLVLAAILIAVPGSSPSLDPLPSLDADKETSDRTSAGRSPTAEPGTARPIAATSPHSASPPVPPATPTPADPTTSAHPSSAPQTPTATSSSTPEATPRPSSGPVGERGVVPPSEGVREASKIAPAIPPKTVKTRPARPSKTPIPAIAPSPEHVPPSQTREPPGRVPGSGPASR